MNTFPYHADIVVPNTSAEDTVSVGGVSALSRIERLIAAVFIATEHIEETVSLKQVARTLATALLSPQESSNEGIALLQSSVRILAVGHYISEQNAKILINAAESLKKESVFLKNSPDTLLKSLTSREQKIQSVFLDGDATLSGFSSTIPAPKKEVLESLKSLKNLSSLLQPVEKLETTKNTESESRTQKDQDLEKNFVSRQVAQKVVKVDSKKEPSLSAGAPHISSGEVSSAKKSLQIPGVQRSSYALQERVPTGFSQNISLLKKEEKKSEKGFTQKAVPKEEKNISRRDRISTALSEKKDTTIKDIMSVFPDISEKTLQRELNDMVEQGLLRRIGERRWSRYELVRFGL